MMVKQEIFDVTVSLMNGIPPYSYILEVLNHHLITQVEITSV